MTKQCLNFIAVMAFARHDIRNVLPAALLGFALTLGAAQTAPPLNQVVAPGASDAPAAGRTKKVEAPASLQPRATWWETMLASREALGEQDAAARRSLADAVTKAFPAGTDSRQQSLETSLGLWRADWKRGDLADLAARFASACGAEQKRAAEEIAKRCKSMADLKAVHGLFN